SPAQLGQQAGNETVILVRDERRYMDTGQNLRHACDVLGERAVHPGYQALRVGDQGDAVSGEHRASEHGYRCFRHAIRHWRLAFWRARVSVHDSSLGVAGSLRPAEQVPAVQSARAATISISIITPRVPAFYPARSGKKFPVLQAKEIGQPP